MEKAIKKLNSVGVPIFTEDHRKNLDYIMNHKWNIMRMFNELALNLIEIKERGDIDQYIPTNMLKVNGEHNEDVLYWYLVKLRKRCVEHDVSKMTIEEFDPYTKKFFRDKDISEEEAEEIEVAFDSHYKSNTHHPENSKFFSMDRDGLLNKLEYILDLSAMSIRFGGNPYNYHKENNHFSLSPELDKLFSECGEVVERIFSSEVDDGKENVSE